MQKQKRTYRFLQQDCKAYLPKIGSVNVYFFKQILKGEKEYLNREEVKVSSVPHIEGLTVQNFLEYARQRQHILKYLPDERDWVHLDRQWICDLLFSIDTDNIQNIIEDAIKMRQKKLEEIQNMTIKIKPEFARALDQCVQFSSILKFFFFTQIIDEKGRSIFLLKDNTRRKRTRTEIEEVKSEEENYQEDKQQFLMEHKRLKTEKQQMQSQIEELNNNQILLNHLLEQGIINENGEIMIQQQFEI